MTYFFSLSVILDESIFFSSLLQEFLLDEIRKISHTGKHVGVPVFSPVRDRSRTAQNPDHAPATRISAFEQIRWRIPNLDHFMDTLNVQLGHGVEDHEGRRPSDLPRNVLHVHKEVNQSILDPTQPLHDGLGNHTMKSR